MANTQSKLSARIGRKRWHLTIFPCMLVVLLAGAVALFWQGQHAQSTRADAGNVVGSPTLPARTVDQILAQMGSPMVGTGAVIEAASRQTNIDDAFALGVWWTETNDGAAGVGLADRNPGSVRGSAGYPAAFDGYTIYPSYSAAIVDWFNLLRSRYVDRGLISAYTICYPYVGTANSYQWAVKVVNLMLRYHGEAPPPTPVPSPTPRPIPTPDQVRIQHKQIHVVAPEPATQGITREAHIFGGVQPPANKPTVPVADPQALVVQQGSSSTSPFITVFGLLAALAIALWGVMIRRSVPAVQLSLMVAAMPTSPASTEASSVALPALYVNEFSPVLVPQSLPSTEQLSWPQPVLSLASVSGGGLLKRYADTDAVRQQVALQATYIYAEEVWGTDTNAGMPVVGVGATSYTEEPSIPVTPAPSPVAEPTRFAGVRRGGLLRRYALEKADQ